MRQLKRATVTQATPGFKQFMYLRGLLWTNPEGHELAPPTRSAAPVARTEPTQRQATTFRNVHSSVAVVCRCFMACRSCDYIVWHRLQFCSVVVWDFEPRRVVGVSRIGDVNTDTVLQKHKQSDGRTQHGRRTRYRATVGPLQFARCTGAPPRQTPGSPFCRHARAITPRLQGSLL